MIVYRPGYPLYIEHAHASRAVPHLVSDIAHSSFALLRFVYLIYSLAEPLTFEQPTRTSSHLVLHLLMRSALVRHPRIVIHFPQMQVLSHIHHRHRLSHLLPQSLRHLPFLRSLLTPSSTGGAPKMFHPSLPLQAQACFLERTRLKITRYLPCHRASLLFYRLRGMPP